MTESKKDLEQVPVADQVLMQLSMQDFVAHYHNSQPHADVATLESFFDELGPKPTKDSEYLELPVHVTFDRVPVSIVKTDSSKNRRNTGNPILDERTQDTFYIFVGDNLQTPFAQLADNSNRWGTFTLDGIFEPLSEENYKTVKKILDDARNEIHVSRRNREEEARQKRSRRLGIISVATVVSLIAAGAGTYRLLNNWWDEEREQRVQAYDASWQNKQFPAPEVVVTDKNEVNNVAIVPYNDELANAPTLRDTSTTTGPRRLDLGLYAGSCNSVYMTELEEDDAVAAAQLPTAEVVPVGFSVDTDKNTITFCAFGGSGDKQKSTQATIIFTVDTKKD